VATELMVNTEANAALLEQVVIGGDLSKLNASDRVAYYRAVCQSVGLNPLTKPFEYLTLNNKLILYAKRDATDQLRGIRGISVERLEREVVEGIYTVTAYGRDASGRTDSALGAVPIETLKGEARANAMMKAETKAKRRLTLSLAGLGWLDELEVEAIGQRVDVDTETGEIVAPTKPKTLAEAITAAAAELPEPGLSGDEFKAWMDAHPINPSDAQAIAHGLFPDQPKGERLSDFQRLVLRDALAEHLEDAAEVDAVLA